MIRLWTVHRHRLPKRTTPTLSQCARDRRNDGLELKPTSRARSIDCPPPLGNCLSPNKRFYNYSALVWCTFFVDASSISDYEYAPTIAPRLHIKACHRRVGKIICRGGLERTTGGRKGLPVASFSDSAIRGVVDEPSVGELCAKRISKIFSLSSELVNSELKGLK